MKSLKKRIKKIAKNKALRIIFSMLPSDTDSKKIDIKMFKKIINNNLDFEKHGFILCSMYEDYEYSDIYETYEELVDLQMDTVADYRRMFETDNAVKEILDKEKNSIYS